MPFAKHYHSTSRLSVGFDVKRLRILVYHSSGVSDFCDAIPEKGSFLATFHSGKSRCRTCCQVSGPGASGFCNQGDSWTNENGPRQCPECFVRSCLNALNTDKPCVTCAKGR